MYTWMITLGDWSGDGHSKTRDYLFTSNFSHEDVGKFFKRIKSVTKFDIENFCDKYEESRLFPEQANDLVDLGFDEEWIYECVDPVYIGYETFIAILTFLLKKVEPTLEMAEFSIPTAIQGVGYGLFYF